MNYLTFETKEHYPISFLVPFINSDSIVKEYINPFNIDKKDTLSLDLFIDKTKKKTSAKDIRNYISEELLPIFREFKIKVVVCSDADYFKVLTKKTKAEPYLGYALDCTFEPEIKVVYVPSYRAIFSDPDKVRAKIAQGMNAVLGLLKGSYEPPGQNIIHNAKYVTDIEDISNALDSLHAYPIISADIEAFSLKHNTAGIGTVAFASDEHNGIAFPVDLNKNKIFIRALLIKFFKTYKGIIIWHNISFDVYVLIYQLFMKGLRDTKGLLEGLDIMLKRWHDTKLIAYLATNSCAGNKLSLKQLSQEFSGNYAVESIEDITKIPLDKLLEYNLVDALSTWYVFKKYYPIMIADKQEDIYNNIFRPAIKDIIQMQLTGLPVDMKRVKEVKQILETDYNNAINNINSLDIVKEFSYRLAENWVIKKNNKLKVKRVTVDDYKENFNPNSSVQLQELLYNFLNLPVIDYTDSKQPSTGADTLEKLKNHTEDINIKSLLSYLVDLKSVSIILSTFIPAFEGAVLGEDGHHYLYGNFNLGGTVSCRLSSSDPNLQNIPATGSKYAKLVKSIFVAPKGYILVGVDFNSLEDMISALTTKDPNKLKVYTDGYDGHSLRAFAYFGDQMEGIVNTVESINSIQTKYKPLRQESKAPTFALTYQGTYKTLINNCGFTEEKALSIEKRYHELYKVSDEYIANKLKQASKDGYITAAFGLRVRTPLLHQVILGTSKTPYEASAEGRTAGNALGQSWCLLNTRAASEFMAKVRESIYRLDILPCAQIHDASYYLIKDDIDIVYYTNTHLIHAVKWQDHPDIAHDQVKLGGELFLCWPSWANEISIPNDASKDEILNIVSKYTEGLK